MTTATQTKNPYLTGNFAPVRDEITAENLEVIGEIPRELQGMFVRNGPNPQFPPIGQYHWFDGDGMLHGVQLQNGQAKYLNRYVRTDGFLKEREAGHAIWTGLLEPPQEDVPGDPTKNTANTALMWHAQKFLATWEGGAPHAIQLPDLGTEGLYTFDDKLESPVTAHPKVDDETGEMLFFGYSFSPPYVQYSIVSPEGDLVKTEPIDIPVPVMMHDFAITKHYTIFMDFPLTFRPERMEKGEPVLAFEKDRPTRFGIMPRYGDNSEVRWFESPSCFAFHSLNAYEEGDEIVLIGCRMQEFSLTGIDDPEQGIPYLYQWRFNLKTGTVQEGQLFELPVDYPRINEAYVGRKMRYGYCAQIQFEPTPLIDAVVKFDFGEGTDQVKTQVHHLGENRYGGEFVFAPRPGATTEDDGWLITFVHDEEKNQSELLILDAQNVEADPVARVIVPRRVPYGFHAAWVSDDEIQAMNS
jgi:carotenoid cleavage dioxygenase-like enzyme